MSTPRPRRDDSGFTLAMTMVVMFLTLTFVGLAVSMALAGLTHSETARSVERAQAAADAGADIAGYRMNKTLLAPASASIIGLTSSVLQTAGCTGLDLTFGNSTSIAGANTNASISAANPTGGLLTLVGIPSGSNFCRTTTSETLVFGSSFL
jgi:Tfp pilus assembly protein PilX